MSPAARPGRRANTTPLTAGQQALVTAEMHWLPAEVTRNVNEGLRRRYGREQFEQEAMLALCESARTFDPVAHPNVPFGAFARSHVRHRLWRAAHLAARVHRVSVSMPVDADGGPFVDAPDHRRAEADPALRLWCSPDYCEQRRCLDWFVRVVLYLRAVEGLTLDEVGAYFRISKERVRQIEDRGVCRLAEFRNRRRVRRQLAGQAAD